MSLSSVILSPPNTVSALMNAVYPVLAVNPVNVAVSVPTVIDWVLTTVPSDAVSSISILRLPSMSL